VKKVNFVVRVDCERVVGLVPLFVPVPACVPVPENFQDVRSKSHVNFRARARARTRARKGWHGHERVGTVTKRRIFVPLLNLCDVNALIIFKIALAIDFI
jgi:hypothetical protein